VQQFSANCRLLGDNYLSLSLPSNKVTSCKFLRRRIKKGMLAAKSIDILGNNILFAGERGILALFCGSNGYLLRCAFQFFFVALI